jgi:hypothetical protein
VYAVPFVSPETVIGDDPVPVSPPGLDVAVNVVVGAPPALAVYATVALVFPLVTAPIVGELGINCIVTLLDAAELRDVPLEFVPVTV